MVVQKYNLYGRIIYTSKSFKINSLISPFGESFFGHYSLLYRGMSYHAKFSAFKTSFLSALQPVTGFHTNSVI